MAREKVPSVMWTAANSDKGPYWIATFANEGPEALANYIETLRNEYRLYKNDKANADYLASCIRTGKRAVEVYRKHFGEI